MKEISKEDFLKIYNQYPSNNFLQIMYKYFSTDMKKSVGTKVIVGLFLIFNILSIILDVIYGMTSVRNISLALGNLPFGFWGVLSLIAFIWNGIRTKKIAKKLGLTYDEYIFYVGLYVS